MGPDGTSSGQEDAFSTRPPLSRRQLREVRVRSLVGLIPVRHRGLEARWIEPFKESGPTCTGSSRQEAHRPGRVPPAWCATGGPPVCAIVNEAQIKGLLRRSRGPRGVLSPWGLRILSRYHRRNPSCSPPVGCATSRRSRIQINGRNPMAGPVWFPTSFLMIEALRKLAPPSARLKVQPRRDGPMVNLFESRKTRQPYDQIFTRDAARAAAALLGRRNFQTIRTGGPHPVPRVLQRTIPGEGSGVLAPDGWTASSHH